MTTRKLYSDKLLDLSLLRNMTKRRLPHILVAFLANFFTVSVPIMMVFDDFVDRFNRYTNWTYEAMIERAVEDVSGIMILNCLAVYVLAVYFGIITLGYMMKRRSAHFYHALPQKRETLYITSITSSLICAAIGALVNIIIAAGELAVFGAGYPEVYSAFFSLATNNILIFLSTYAITVFAGSFSGNRVVQFLMTLVIMLYPLATYAGLILMRQSHAYYFNPDYFFTQEIVQWLSPFAHVILNYRASVSVLTVILALVGTVALLVGGLFIYKKRAIENSEKPIVFKKLGSVLKYMFMFTVTIYAGAFFYTIEYNEASLVFGFASGATLSFMLFNTILEKSPKAMFKNLKGLAIFAAAFAVYALIFCFDVFKLDNCIPNDKFITYAEIRTDSVEYEDNRFDSPEMLAALTTLLENQQKADAMNVSNPYDSYNSTFNVTATMHTKLGVPIARKYRITKYTDGADAFLKLFADDARLQEAHDKTVAKLQSFYGNGYTAELRIQMGRYINVECPLDKILPLYLSEAPKMNYDTLSAPSIGNFIIRYVRDSEERALYNSYDVRGDAYIFNEFPLYENMTKTIEYLDMLSESLSENAGAEEKASDIWNSDVYDILEARVYDIRSGISVAATGRRNFITRLDVYPYKNIDEKLAKALHEKFNRYNDGDEADVCRLFSAFDKEYILEIRYKYKDVDLTDPKYTEYYEKYYDDFGITHASAEITIDTGFSQIVMPFPKGMVPAEVKALF